MILDKLLNEIKIYCKLNEIEDVDKFINNCIAIGFNYEKYGRIPFGVNTEITTQPQTSIVYTKKEESVNKKENKTDFYGE